jgi:hypothetical protein
MLTFAGLRRSLSKAGRVESRLRSIGLCFYAGALLQALASLGINVRGLWDAATLAIFGFLIGSRRSRIAAILAAIHAGASAVLVYPHQVADPAVGVHRGGTFWVFAGLFVLSLFAIHATFTYHRTDHEGQP